MAPSNNLSPVDKKGEMLFVPVRVVMQGSTEILQFSFPNLTLLSQTSLRKVGADFKPFKDLR